MFQVNEIKPVGYDKHGPKWNADDVNKVVVNEINSEDGTYFKRCAQDVNKDFHNATELVKAEQRLFHNSLENLKTKTDDLKKEIKRVSGDVRKAADDLASGLLKVEKQANFANLERYVSLLERAATSMQTLAELEKAGKLEKIAGALK
jgi:predicted  nucleic acid-binding Zn-ribbon protein